MEKPMERVMEQTMAVPQVLGCVFADHQGLCLGAKGCASADSAGILSAIAEQASKLEPDSRQPAISLGSDNKVCIIQRHATMTGAIYKNI